MQQTIVTRVALALTGLLAVAAVLFALGASRGGDPSVPDHPAGGPAAPIDGGAAYATYCVACHDAAGLAADLQGAADVDGAAAELLELLATHGGAGEPANRAIVEYLRALTAS